MKKVGLSLMTAILGGAIAVGAYKMVETKATDASTFEDRQKVYFASNHIAPLVSSAGTVDFTQAAAAVTPAVVYIRTTYSASQGGGQDQMEQMFGDMFGMRRRQQGPQKASGSGVIISTDGYIVTNNHVVEKADKIEITTNDKRTFQAKVIGTDPNTDLALIKINATNMPIVKFGNSDDAKVGEWVLAVGNPFNLASTVTAGIVSAKGRTVGIIGRGENDDEDNSPFSSPNSNRSQLQTPSLNRAVESFIQTDAVINPGNSGGALVNTRGELIGINSAILSHTGSYEGYGFAIPINLAKKVLNDIEKFGKVKRGYVGVQFRELNPDAAQELSIKTTNGLYVNELVKGGGAEQAGIRKGDIITKVEGNTVNESSDLQEKVARLQPGDKIRLTVLRDGKEQTFAVTLKADDSNLLAGSGRSKSSEEVYNNLGASFAPLSNAQKQKYNIESGVVVSQVRPGRMFDQLGIEEGSVITRINKIPVSSPEAIDKAISSIKNGTMTISGISPDGSTFNNVYRMDK